MPKNYSAFREGMVLRDHLALDRTILASERTFLAYLRTSIGFLASGVAAIKLLEGTPAIHVLGWLMISASPIFLVLGSLRYALVRKKLYTLERTEEGRHVSQSAASPEPPHQTEKT